jgi:hypothetical protein
MSEISNAAIGEKKEEADFPEGIKARLVKLRDTYNNVAVSEKRNLDLPTIIKEKLTDLKVNYSDEIPEKIIHGFEKPENNKYKVLRAWWTKMIPYLGLGISENVIQDSQLREKVKTFTEKYTSEDFHKQPRTTKKDIQKANQLITLVLKAI